MTGTAAELDSALAEFETAARGLRSVLRAAGPLILPAGLTAGAADGPADGGLPIDGSLRRALFAALRDRYGTELDRPDRLDKLSLLAGHEVASINHLTRAEARRVLATLRNLSTGNPGPAAADRRIASARAYIRRAAAEDRISRGDRDRYLTEFDSIVRAAATPDAALAAIRQRAVTHHDDGDICRDGLNGFLSAAGLTPHR